MKITVLNECGYDEAAYGFSLSYNSNPTRAKQILHKYAWGIPGESKFLESIILWVSIDATRFFWSEFDTYRHLSKNSESTMHTLGKRTLEQDTDFDEPMDAELLAVVNRLVVQYQKKEISLRRLKAHLPEGFLQERQVRLDYKSLQGMYTQRHKHRLVDWTWFFEQLLPQIQHPEFIVRSND